MIIGLLLAAIALASAVPVEDNEAVSVAESSNDRVARAGPSTFSRLQ